MNERDDVVPVTVDHVETGRRRGDTTEVIVSGDNLDQDVTVMAADQPLSAHASGAHALHVEVPDAVIDQDVSVEIVSPDGTTVGLDLSEIRSEASIGGEAWDTGLTGDGDEAFGGGLAGDGDTDF